MKEKLWPLDVSGPTSLASVETEKGYIYVRLFVRDDGVVVAKPMVSSDKVA